MEVLFQLLGDWGYVCIWYQAKSHEMEKICSYASQRHLAGYCISHPKSGFSSEVNVFLVGKINTLVKVPDTGRVPSFSLIMK